MRGWVKWLTPEETAEYRVWQRRGTKKKKPKQAQKHARKIFAAAKEKASKRCQLYLHVTFWPKFNVAKDGTERLSVLKMAASPPWPRVSDKLRSALRQAYEAKRWNYLNFPILECCICESEKAVEKHHIVPIAYGGLNAEINLLKIGLACHDEIHPWLKKAAS